MRASVPPCSPSPAPASSRMTRFDGDSLMPVRASVACGVRKVGPACKSAVSAHAIEFTHPTRPLSGWGERRAIARRRQDLERIAAPRRPAVVHQLATALRGRPHGRRLLLDVVRRLAGRAGVHARNVDAERPVQAGHLRHLATGAREASHSRSASISCRVASPVRQTAQTNATPSGASTRDSRTEHGQSRSPTKSRSSGHRSQPELAPQKEHGYGRYLRQR